MRAEQGGYTHTFFVLSTEHKVIFVGWQNPLQAANKSLLINL